MLSIRSIQTILYSLFMTSLLLALLSISFAEVRKSTNYQLQSDSLNIGGGFSSSTNYSQESTVGEAATGPSDSTSYSLRAGYQQMQEVYVSLSVSGDVAMSPSLPGLTGGDSNGSTTLTVITDSPSGYQLTISAENNPAMQSGSNSIADYDDGGTADFTFAIGTTDAHLGYSPEGVDIAQKFLDNNAGTCGVGSFDAPLSCWDGLSTSDVVFATGAGTNHPSGATTTLNFRVGIGGGAGVETGVYTATTTVTALPL
jgi:hypothetical protein